MWSVLWATMLPVRLREVSSGLSFQRSAVPSWLSGGSLDLIWSKTSPGLQRDLHPANTDLSMSRVLVIGRVTESRGRGGCVTASVNLSVKTACNLWEEKRIVCICKHFFHCFLFVLALNPWNKPPLRRAYRCLTCHLTLLSNGMWRVFSLLPGQGSCLQSEEHLSLQINLSARGDRPADLDKLKPYVIEHIVVLLMAPTAGAAAAGQSASLSLFLWECEAKSTIKQN